MIKRVVLHLGLHKTATSSIQEALFNKKNRNRLLSHNILYPISFGANHGQALYSMFCDHPERFFSNISEGLSKSDIEERNLVYKKQLIEEVENGGQETLLISGEAFSLLPENNMQRLRDFLIEVTNKEVEFKVVFYVRNPVNLLISDLQQGIKMEFNTYEKELNYRYNIIKDLFQKRLSPAMRVFSDYEIQFCKFEETLKHKFGPVGYFLKSIGLDEETIGDFVIDKYNESISAEAVDVISFINSHLPLYRRGKIGRGRSYSDTRRLKAIGVKTFDVPIEEKRNLYQNAVGDIEWLRRNTGIDYQEMELSDKYRSITLTMDLLNQYKGIFCDLSFELQKLVIQYLHSKLTDDSIEYGENIRSVVAEIVGLIDAIEYKKKMANEIRRELKIRNRFNDDYIFNTMNNFLTELSELEDNKSIAQSLIRSDMRNCFIEYVEMKSAEYDWDSKECSESNAERTVTNKSEKSALLSIYGEKGKSFLVTMKNLGLYVKGLVTGLDGFDKEYYVNKYLNTNESKSDPLFHFIMKGVYLGYWPNNGFNTKWYIFTHPKIVATGDNALAHFNKTMGSGVGTAEKQ